MEQITLINETEILHEQWISRQFTDVYTGAYTKTAIAINGEDPERRGIALRSHVEDANRLLVNQKFIIAIRFYSFGDIASVDVVSIPLGYHKNIFADHMKNLNWKHGAASAVLLLVSITSVILILLLNGVVGAYLSYRLPEVM